MAKVDPYEEELGPLKHVHASKDGHKMRWEKGVNWIKREMMVYEARNSQGRELLFCYGVYSFNIQGEICEGILLEDASGSNWNSLEKWFEEEQRHKALTVPIFDCMWRAAFRTQELFTTQGLLVLHDTLHEFLFVKGSRNFVPVVAVGFSKAEREEDVRKWLEENNKRRKIPTATMQVWHEAADESLRSLIAFALPLESEIWRDSVEARKLEER